MLSEKYWLLIATAIGLIRLVQTSPLKVEERFACRKTKVAVLGAGAAGIFAAQALHNASIDDFVIVEYNDVIGGRVAHTTFGARGHEYTVELGANWVEGLHSKGGPENPIWRLAKKWKLETKPSHFGNVSTYNETGAVDYTDLFHLFNNHYTRFQRDAGYILSENLQDRSARAGLQLSGWKPNLNTTMQTIEWFGLDYEYAQTPELCSQEWAVINANTTFNQYSARNNYVFDPRGYSAIIRGEASTFLRHNDPRLLLNTIVTDISYSDDGVTVHASDGTCIEADYAICTFSVGVLQHDVVKFHPDLPVWKRTGIESMGMATYTKIFLQFPPDKIFWDHNTQFFLYADPSQRGYYPAWQSLDCPGFLPGSGIFFVTVVQDQSFQVELQSDDETKAQVLEVLRKMFGAEKVPDPIAFMYPRWTLVPWAFGTYSNWPPGYTLEMHQNLRANVGRLWFAGEATSTPYYGYLHGAYFEGQNAAITIAQCINGNATACDSDPHYAKLHGTTQQDQLIPENGWTVSSFLDYGG